MNVVNVKIKITKNDEIKNNQLERIKDSEGGTTNIYYDKNGNIKDIYYAVGYQENYSYDVHQQVIKIETNANKTWYYEYDAEGDRISERKTYEVKESGYDYVSNQGWYEYLDELTFSEVEKLVKEGKVEDTFESFRKWREIR